MRYAVIGTLLNRLFGTDFDVMNETRRQQTTKGEQQSLVFCFIHSLTDHSTVVVLDARSFLVLFNRHLDVQGEEHECPGYGC